MEVVSRMENIARKKSIFNWLKYGRPVKHKARDKGRA